MANFNIYSIDDWAASTNYRKNAIVKNNNLYYYSLINHTSSSSLTTDITNGLMGGRILDNSEDKAYFFWKPSYRATVDNEPKIKKIQFGDSYVQRLSDGISNILPSISLTFDNIDIDETTAILHFLETRAGSESFVYLPGAPRGTLSRWVCEKWSDSQQFYNNYTIQARFDRSST
jgi:phage-related protein